MTSGAASSLFRFSSAICFHRRIGSLPLSTFLLMRTVWIRPGEARCAIERTELGVSASLARKGPRLLGLRRGEVSGHVEGIHFYVSGDLAGIERAAVVHSQG